MLAVPDLLIPVSEPVYDLVMSETQEPTLADVLAKVLEALNHYANSFFQLSGRVDALISVVSEVHPEIRDRLNSLVQAKQDEGVTHWAESLRQVEIINATLKGSVN